MEFKPIEEIQFTSLEQVKEFFEKKLIEYDKISLLSNHKEIDLKGKREIKKRIAICKRMISMKDSLKDAKNLLNRLNNIEKQCKTISNTITEVKEDTDSLKKICEAIAKNNVFLSLILYTLQPNIINYLKILNNYYKYLELQTKLQKDKKTGSE
jgi:hypothetical protein